MRRAAATATLSMLPPREAITGLSKYSKEGVLLHSLQSSPAIRHRASQQRNFASWILNPLINSIIIRPVAPTLASSYCLGLGLITPMTSQILGVAS